ncbi:MAG: hypothetical protein PHS07_03435 [Patescibacteria group bacterium]|nr:hypothetical protein [Patescibacteria group bacterium]
MKISEILALVVIMIISITVLAVCLALSYCAGAAIGWALLPEGSSIKIVAIPISVVVGVVFYCVCWISDTLSSAKKRKYDRIVQSTLIGFPVGVVIALLVFSPILGASKVEDFIHNPVAFILIGGAMGAMIGFMLSVCIPEKTEKPSPKTIKSALPKTPSPTVTSTPLPPTIVTPISTPIPGPSPALLQVICGALGKKP